MARLIYARRAFADLDRIVQFLSEQGDPVISAAFDAISDGIGVLARHPRIGRRVEHGLRELVISHGKTGYVALYDYRARERLVVVLAIRHQREAGYLEE